MNNLEIALCDLNEDYILKFANRLMEKAGVVVHVFTTSEGFFSAENDFDVCILTKEFEEITGFRPKGSNGHKYFICETLAEEEEDCIYKYQSIDSILDAITELREVGQVIASTKKSNEKSKFVGVYSPASHELQLPFSMALGQSFRTNGRVLFMDLEELSIMPDLVGKGTNRNLMDLLYEISTGNQKIDLSKYVTAFMGFDYIEPFLNPNEISEIDEETWNGLFNLLANSEYEVVVVLFGRAISGFAKFISGMNKLYVLGRPGDYFRKSQDAFMDYLDRINIEVDVECVSLPMSAGNLSDGTYQLETLLQGNLGMFVKRVMKTQVNNTLENYG